MCGISIILGSSASENACYTSLSRIIHRGSKQFEIQEIQQKYIVMGANRLPIQGRLQGHQPLSNEDKTVWAVQNGEVFNYRALKEILENKGHIFSTDSDTEIYPHLREEYDIDCVKYIDSEMFAFGVYDTKSNDLYVARDRRGVKPLYYGYHTDGSIHFASEVKQLVQFEDIDKVYNFPKGHYFYKGKFVPRAKEIKIGTGSKNEKESIETLTTALVQAVKKRVDTDLPIGVFLSGGVDSSLIMEIATRFHPNVMAIILGKPGAPDYEYAVRLCKDRNYNYHVVHPEEQWEEKIESLVYHTETYEPLIIRQALANDLCSQAAQQLGLHIVLLGEGSDELFAGYNEFGTLSDSLINAGCYQLLNHLDKGHFKRVDRMAMKYTIETRCPFFDDAVVENAFSISGGLKVKKEFHNVTMKYILRKVAEQFLPDYIVWRYKLPFANGAGMSVGNNFKKEDGSLSHRIKKTFEDQFSVEYMYSDKYHLDTLEEKYLFSLYQKNGFTKLVDDHHRLVVKDTLCIIDKNHARKILIAEFDFLPLYFPVYYAQELGLFSARGLEVEFISTGGDDKTYAALANNSATMGIADPIFSMSNDVNGVHGEMIGELISALPLVAVTIHPEIKVNSLQDFSQYHIGSYEKYSTTHTYAINALSECQITPIFHQDVLKALVNRDVDIAIVLREQANEICQLGGHILWDFSQDNKQIAFSGFTITSLISDHQKVQTKKVMAAIQEAVVYIKKRPTRALGVMQKLFPTYQALDKTLYEYLGLRNDKVLPQEGTVKRSYDMRKKIYPQMFKRFQGYFFQPTYADKILTTMKVRKFSRTQPYKEEEIGELLQRSITKNTPIKFVGFWGASDKERMDEHDNRTLDYMKEYMDWITKEHVLGVEITWILADIHAQNNGFKKSRYTNYFKRLLPEFKKRNMKYILLSDIYKKNNFLRLDVFDSQFQTVNQKREEISFASKLEDQAKKHYQQQNALIGAKRYYTLRVIEKEILEKEFSDNIFFAYSDSDMQPLYPNIPTLYLWTEKKGYSDLPRFSKY